MAGIRGVILDVDGTLVDSNRAHARAWARTLQAHGFAGDEERLLRLIGMGSDKLLPKAAGVEKDSPIGKQLVEQRRKLFQREFLPQLQATAGARELLERMRERGLKLVVASSASADELEPLLEVAGASDLVEERTSSSDAEHSKPDPDIVQAALDNLGLPAEQVLMIGDTPYDVEAAGRIGVRLIGLRSGGWDERGLAGALAVYDDPADLLHHYDESPLAKDKG